MSRAVAALPDCGAAGVGVLLLGVGLGVILKTELGVIQESQDDLVVKSFRSRTS